MPSDASGVYSLPAGYLATSGATIEVSQHNPVLEDIATSLTARLQRNGVGPMTGPLKAANGSVDAPAIAFASAPSTGFYKTASGFAVAVSGVKVAEFTSGFSFRYLGELIPTSTSTVPPLTVQPYGQTLSRTTYADLWALAQVEIAGGALFYNNGDGSTTFGIGDMRGRVPAMIDGGIGRLTPTYFGTNAVPVGAVGGSEGMTLTIAQMPVHTPSGTITNGAITSSAPGLQGIGGSSSQLFNGGGAAYNINPIFISSTQAASTFTGNSIGSGAGHNNVQPTMTCNYLLYVGA